MKIAFFLPFSNDGVGGGDRKFTIYLKYLSRSHFEIYKIRIAPTLTSPTEEQSSDDTDKCYSMSKEFLSNFMSDHTIPYFYIAGAILPTQTVALLLEKYVGIINVNFTRCYVPHHNVLNLIISKTDYWKLRWMHTSLINAYVVYNPIDVEKREAFSDKNSGMYREYFKTKKLIVGRIARHEPSKWHFLIIFTLLYLSIKRNFSFGFLFVGMPRLYRKCIHWFCSAAFKKCILFLPQMRSDKDIAEFYTSIDIFRQTSWIGESFGNVIAESFCFKKPVITDYKKFLRNGKVREDLYDAQIELVDNATNGRYANNPWRIVEILEGCTQNIIQEYGANGHKKVISEYNIVSTAETFTKIVYDFMERRTHSKESQEVEGCIGKPSYEEVQRYEEEYKARIAECERENMLPTSKRVYFGILSWLWRFIEYLYLLFRKVLRYMRFDLEDIY